MKRIFGGYRSRLLFIAAFIAAVNMAFLSCGKGPDEEPATSTGIQSTVQNVPCPAGGTVDVTIQSTGLYDPSVAEVPVKGIVKWTNQTANQTYRITSTNNPDGEFVVGPIGPNGGTACLQFTAAGTFEYECDADDHGTIIVQ